jgi:hypothetical protein
MATLGLPEQDRKISQAACNGMPTPFGLRVIYAPLEAGLSHYERSTAAHLSDTGSLQTAIRFADKIDFGKSMGDAPA